LLDEPESALDFRYRYRMLDMLRGWVKDEGRAAIVTLHDPSLALNYCDRLLLLSNGSVLGSICPQTDDLDQTERMLSQIYGQISLQLCRTRNGQTRIVMLKEDEE
jgi:iron complex transport system ATP-binding protein